MREALEVENSVSEIRVAWTGLHRAVDVNTREEFDDFLDRNNHRSLFSLPAGLRDMPLEALASRVLALPNEEDQQHALASVVAAATGRLPHSDVLRSARMGLQHLRQREHDLIDQGGAAAQQVRAGDNVREVAQRHGISSSRAIEFLEIMAAPHGWLQLTQGRTLPQAWQATGVNSHVARAELERLALARIALPQIAQGGNPQAVMQGLGLPIDVPTLRQREGLARVQAGVPVPTVMQRMGIRDPDEVRTFVRLAYQRVGVGRVLRGDAPQAVVDGMFQVQHRHWLSASRRWVEGLAMGFNHADARQQLRMQRAQAQADALVMLLPNAPQHGRRPIWRRLVALVRPARDQANAPVQPPPNAPQRRRRPG